jgi:hypothetical protein
MLIKESRTPKSFIIKILWKEMGLGNVEAMTIDNKDRIEMERRATSFS